MIIAGTGHRPNKLGGYSYDAFEKLIKLAESYLSSNKDVTKVISGMALGWDQALAQAAVNLNIPFIAAVPCYNQDKMWPKGSQDYYSDLLKKAHEIVYVTKSEYTYKCMQDRNIWMVDNCDILLTVYDGTPGGTDNCIQYASTQLKEIVNLYNEYIKIKGL